jgi:hypothetical protein
MSELQAKRDELQQHLTQTTDRLAELDKEIAEGKKVELRHGDSFGDGYNVIIAIYVSETDKWRLSYNDKSGHEMSKEEILKRIKGCGYSFICNIFDDLKDMHKDVEEFSVDGATFKIDKRCPVATVDICCWPDQTTKTFSLDEFDKVVLGLRQIQAKLKRQEAKK